MVARRTHVHCVFKVQLKAYKFARDACVKHAVNERASVSGGPDFVSHSTYWGFAPEPHFVSRPLDANTCCHY